MEHLEAAVLGGCVLGGGGGGSMEKGLRTAKLGLELAPVTLVDPEDLDEDTVLVNVSNVGAPSAADAWVEPMDNGRVVTVLCEKMGIRAEGLLQMRREEAPRSTAGCKALSSAFPSLTHPVTAGRILPV